MRVPAAVDEPNAITLNADSGGESARIELDLGHATNFFLDARGVWNVIFNAVNTGPFNPFGAANQ